MKIAVMADIHSNLAALEVVLADIARWRPDLVWVGGDIINRGPQPGQCVARVLEMVAREEWQVIRGNHEDYVLSYQAGDWPTSGPPYELMGHARWTFARIEPYAAALAAFPDELVLAEPAGTQLRLVHASMLGNRNGIFPKTSDEELREKIAPAPDVFLAGHTHRPLLRRLDGTLVINVGSVGQPFDDDPRSAYARLTLRDDEWQAEIVRLAYDRALTDRLFFESGYLAESGDFARLILAEHRRATPLIPGWYRAYEPAVQAGEISMRASVNRYLQELGITDV
ncbi:MAG: metallophosphoesterase family protein [Anaerolineales bacterium]|nr:metallophosphoesterase family protein [Anaerolineales bacterium]